VPSNTLTFTESGSYDISDDGLGFTGRTIALGTEGMEVSLNVQSDITGLSQITVSSLLGQVRTLNLNLNSYAVTVSGGGNLAVCRGATLEVTGEAGSALNVNGVSNYIAAIGGREGQGAGSMTFKGSVTVNANADNGSAYQRGAGIGGPSRTGGSNTDYNSNGSVFILENASVTASGGNGNDGGGGCGAGIGGGGTSSGTTAGGGPGTITINTTGVVRATAGTGGGYAAAIGAGGSMGTNIPPSGTINILQGTVITSGSYGIGSGKNGSNYNPNNTAIRISGGTVITAQLRSSTAPVISGGNVWATMPPPSNTPTTPQAINASGTPVYPNYVLKDYSATGGPATTVGASFVSPDNNYTAMLVDLNSLSTSVNADLSGVVWLPGTASPGTAQAAIAELASGADATLTSASLNSNLAYSSSMTSNLFGYQSTTTLVIASPAILPALQPVNTPFSVITAGVSGTTTSTTGITLYMRAVGGATALQLTEAGTVIGTIPTLGASGQLQGDTWGWVESASAPTDTTTFNPIPSGYSPVFTTTASGPFSANLYFGASVTFSTPAGLGYACQLEYLAVANP
ncbi:MAG: hypothetical protein LBL23_05565, partial [Coriobacteriales bacterium]|nr:hypothetical protein [Coriobacteriales bacterium]